MSFLFIFTILFIKKLLTKIRVIATLTLKGFTDAWEQRKLESLSEHKGGTSIGKYFSSRGTNKN